MKKLIFILGLAASTAGLYIAYLGFTQIDTLDVLTLGVYLGGSFILMTIGLYMSLVVFMKKKTASNDHSDEETLEEVLLDLDEDEDIDPNILSMSEPTSMIEDTMVLNLFEDKQTTLIQDDETITDRNPSNDIQTEDDLDVDDQYQEEEIKIDEDEELFIEEDESIADINEIISEEKPLESLIEEIEEQSDSTSNEQTLNSD